MTGSTSLDKQQSQVDKFKKAAYELEVDEGEARWDEQLRKIAKQKLKDEKPAD